MTALELPAASALASSFAPGILLNLGGAALRALAAAGVAGAALSLLRVRNVLAQKTAWSVVLAGAILMPLLAPWAARQGWIPTRIPFQLSSASSAAAWAQARLASIRLARQTAPITSSPTSSATTSLDTRLAEPTAVPPLTVDERLAAPAIAPEKTAPLAAPISFASMPQETSTTHALTGPIGPQLPTPVTPPRPVSALSTAINTIWPLYLLIAAALLVRLFYGFAAALRLWRDAQPISLTGVRIPVRVHVEISSPVTIGSGILLPADYVSWDDEKLRVVLAHEQSHLRQRDFYLQLAAGLYAAIFWFSPLGWWLQRKLSDLSEAISDRAAVSEAASRAAYAQVLLEFAAQSNNNWSSTAQFGVAMARTARISQRIERLLNETHFRQSFAGSRMRLAIAVLLAPVAVFAATASFHAEAKAQAAHDQTPATAASPQEQTTGVSHPDSAPIETVPEQAQQPLPAAAPVAPIAPATVSVSAPVAPPAPPVPPVVGLGAGLSSGTSSAYGLSGNLQPLYGLSAGTGAAYGLGSSYAYQNNGSSNTTISSQNSHSIQLAGSGSFYSLSKNDDSYALIDSQSDKHTLFLGDWNENVHEQIDKARHAAHGSFFWFTHDGKPYIIDDPSVVAHIREIFKPVEQLAATPEPLTKGQKDQLARQKAEIERQMAELKQRMPDFEKQMADFRARQPEFQKQMAELTSEMAKIQMPKMPVIDERQLADLKQQMANLRYNQPDFNKKMAELSQKMATLSIPQVPQIDEKKLAAINSQIAALTRKYTDGQSSYTERSAEYSAWASEYGKLGEKLGKLYGDDYGKAYSEHYSRLGEKIRQSGEEANRQMRSIIDESLKNGKARPVE